MFAHVTLPQILQQGLLILDGGLTLLVNELDAQAVGLVGTHSHFNAILAQVLRVQLLVGLRESRSYLLRAIFIRLPQKMQVHDLIAFYRFLIYKFKFA